jgi:hypothetical protein
MAIEILTKADLYEFRKSLLEDIRKILKEKRERRSRNCKDIFNGMRFLNTQ